MISDFERVRQIHFVSNHTVWGGSCGCSVKPNRLINFSQAMERMPLLSESRISSVSEYKTSSEYCSASLGPVSRISVKSMACKLGQWRIRCLRSCKDVRSGIAMRRTNGPVKVLMPYETGGSIIFSVFKPGQCKCRYQFWRS